MTPQDFFVADKTASFGWLHMIRGGEVWCC